MTQNLEIRRMRCPLAPVNTKCGKSGYRKIGKLCEQPFLSTLCDWRALCHSVVLSGAAVLLSRAGAGIAVFPSTFASIAAIGCTKQNTNSTIEKLKRCVSPLTILRTYNNYGTCTMSFLCFPEERS